MSQRPQIPDSKWRKARASSGNGACVETAETGGVHHVRDSKDKAGPILSFTPHEWTAFLTGVKTGNFDL